MPTKDGTVPGYGPGTRPNPNADKVCARGFVGCGQTAGTYNPATQKQKGRKSHSKACQEWWRASGAASLQSERRCPRMTPEEMVELKSQAAQEHLKLPIAGASGCAASATVAQPKNQPYLAPGLRSFPAAAAPVFSQAAEMAAVAPDSRLKLWAETDDNHSLIGLPLRLCFGALGECHGTVTSCKGDMYAVTWTCGPRHDEQFRSDSISLEGVLGWHLRTHAAPPAPTDEDEGDYWPRWDDHKKRGKHCPLLDVPTSDAKLVDFELPMDARAFFAGVDTDRDSRWWATLARLNDPAAAHMYAPAIVSYPLPWLLTIILVTKEEMGDPSVKLPTLVVAGKDEVYDLADQFARRLSGSSSSHMGYGELAELERIVRAVAATVPVAGRRASDASWHRAYMNVEALLLTLSHRFEQANDVRA